MRREGRMIFAACVVGSLCVAFLTVRQAGAQGQGVPEKTLGAPREWREVAVRVDRMLSDRKFAEARAICQQGYDSATDDESRALFLRGVAETYKEEHVFDRGIEVFLQVIERFPHSAQVSWAKAGVAECYYYKAKYFRQVKENAPIFIALLEQFVREYPGHERIAGALFVLGWGYEQLGDEAAAVARYERAVNLYPTYLWADQCFDQLIALHQEAQRWDAAIATARRYLACLPNKNPAAAQLSIGNSYMGKGDLPSATGEFEKTVARYPQASAECAVALLQKARCQATVGSVADARATLERLLKAYPSSNVAAEAKAALAELP